MRRTCPRCMGGMMPRRRSALHGITIGRCMRGSVFIRRGQCLKMRWNEFADWVSFDPNGSAFIGPGTPSWVVFLDSFHGALRQTRKSWLCVTCRDTTRSRPKFSKISRTATSPATRRPTWKERRGIWNPEPARTRSHSTDEVRDLSRVVLFRERPDESLCCRSAPEPA